MHRPVDHLAHEIGSGRRELVDAARAVHDEGAARTELYEDIRDHRHEGGVVDADDLAARPGRVGQGAEHVEDRTRGELAAHRCGVTHRWVVEGREHESEPELVDRAGNRLGGELEIEAELLEHIRGARRRRHGAIAVLGDSGARRCRDERCRGRDVERPAAVAPGAGGVDEVVALGVHRDHVVAHRLCGAGDLVRRLTLDPQGDEEASDLRLRRTAAHDRSHHLARLGARQVFTVEQLSERRLDHRAAPPRKFRASTSPHGVKTDSGWNWTPYTGSSS